MLVAVIDVGSNSVRLLVADVEEGTVRRRRRERVYLRLGDDAQHLGRIGPEKLEEARKVIAGFASAAREAGAARLQTFVTAPARQAANREDLIRALLAATHAPVVALSAEDEGRLAWEGAVARGEDLPEVVAAVDLGGGSCEIAIGTPSLGAVWIRSFEAGALRVTRSFLGRPEAVCLHDARDHIAELFAGPRPPLPDLTLAVGGTARAVAKIVGLRFGHDELLELAERLVRSRPSEVAGRYGVTEERAETLVGGTLVLAEVARVLGTDLELGRGGLREGAALALARTNELAA